jgi:hypothetical protein
MRTPAYSLAHIADPAVMNREFTPDFLRTQVRSVATGNFMGLPPPPQIPKKPHKPMRFPDAGREVRSSGATPKVSAGNTQDDRLDPRNLVIAPEVQFSGQQRNVSIEIVSMKRFLSRLVLMIATETTPVSDRTGRFEKSMGCERYVL